MAVPADISNELIQELYQYNNSVLDEFNLHALLRKADKLLGVDRVKSYMLKGMIYSLVWDVERTKAFFQKAEAIAPANLELLINMAVTYGRLSYDNLSRDYWYKSHKIARSTPAILSRYLEICVGTSRPDLASEAMDIYLAAGGEMNREIERLQKSISNCQTSFEALGIDISTANEMHSLVGDVLRRYNVRDQNSRVWLNDEDGMAYLAGFIAIDVPIETLSSMNESLTDLVVEKFSFEDSEKIVYQFVPLDVEDDFSVDDGVHHCKEA